MGSPADPDRRQRSPAWFRNSLLLCLAAIATLAATGLAQYPNFFRQRGALLYVYEMAGILTVYAILILLLAHTQGALWDTIRKRAVLCGTATGTVEVLNITLENVAPAIAHSPGFAITFMLIVFLAWGAAAAWTMRVTRIRWMAVITAVSSAGICMLIAVLAGFLMQLFLTRPNLAEVARWAEYKRSGWADVQAFALANTLDSGFTHLLLAPLVAALFGTLGTLIVRTSRNAAPPLTPSTPPAS